VSGATSGSLRLGPWRKAVSAWLTVKRRWSDAELGLTLAPLLFGWRHRVGAVAGGAAHAVSSGVGHNNKSGALLNGKLQDDLLNGELFLTLNESQILIEQ
jgi:hypothetical protein